MPFGTVWSCERWNDVLDSGLDPSREVANFMGMEWRN